MKILTDIEKANFNRSKGDTKKTNTLSNIKVLDTLIDYWKYTNYKKKTQLSKKQKVQMYAALTSRSKLDSDSANAIWFRKPSSLNPVLGHLNQKLSLSRDIDQDSFNLNYTNGGNALMDTPRKVENSAYIEYLKSNLNGMGKTSKLNEFEFVNIYSIPTFMLNLKKIVECQSWF